MKKYLIKHWPLMGIGGLIIVVFLYFLGAARELAQITSSMDTHSEEGLRLKNIHYTQNNPDDKVKWTLDAKEVQFSQDRQRLSFSDFLFEADFVDRRSIKLEGKKGDYDKNSGEINLQGNLRGHTDNGYVILADHFLFKHKEGILITEEPVKIIGPDITVSGRGAYFDVEKRILRILSGVTTTITGKGGLIS
ncbi:MAG: LPS export ABC transporter periplasmic protein LptC [Pseudomonadota bacterium]